MSNSIGCGSNSPLLRCLWIKIEVHVLKILMAALLILFPTLTFASPQEYKCKIKPSDGGSWVPREGVFRIDTEKNTATAFDPMIKYIYKAPIAIKLSTEQDGSYKLRWKIKGIPVNMSRTVDGITEARWETKVTARYVVKLNPETRQLSLKGYTGHAGRISAAGTCKLEG